MARRSVPARTRAAAGLALALLAPAAASGWTAKTQVMIAENALTIAPDDLRRQLDRHAARYREGCLAPFANADPAARYELGDGGGRLGERIVAETERAIRAIRSHRPFRDIAHQMGVVSHYVAEANNPLSTADSDPLEARFSGDYLRYVERTQERFAVVFYGEGRALAGAESLSALLHRTLARGRRLYPSIGREYRRVGGPPGLEKFDDKSVAFAVGALAVSHAVSDVGAILRYVWLEAGGADERPLPLGAPHADHPAGR